MRGRPAADAIAAHLNQQGAAEWPSEVSLAHAADWDGREHKHEI
jgi:hypothetical protein